MAKKKNNSALKKLDTYMPICVSLCENSGFFSEVNANVCKKQGHLELTLVNGEPDTSIRMTCDADELVVYCDGRDVFDSRVKASTLAYNVNAGISHIQRYIADKKDAANKE